MIRSIKKKLSAKLFIITFFLLGLACSGTFLCISKLLPSTYSDLINSNTNKMAVLLVEELSGYGSLSECEKALTRFSEESDAVFWLEDKYGSTVYPKSISSETNIFSSDTAITFDENMPRMAMISTNEKKTNYYTINLKNGDTYTLVVQVDLFVVRQTTDVLWSIFPYVISMVFVLSLLCSVFYARYITQPIVRLSQTSKQMAALDFTGKCDENREDELGCLAQSLNTLSSALSATLIDFQTANKQLKTDMEREQELELQRHDFFSAASHELKTPLTILKGHLSGMLNNIKGYENHMAYMERSLAVVDKMELLVKELLYISRADSNKGFVYKTVDLAELLRIQIAGITDLLIEKGQCLNVDIPDSLLCELEHSQMERAIQNILVNAIRYSPNGGQVNITLSNIGNIVRCEIENTGIHISDNALIHLFEAFYRIDISRNRNTGGTGLGLYIVRKIMDAHHARYDIENSSNGVIFWFELPKQQINNSI